MSAGTRPDAPTGRAPWLRLAALAALVLLAYWAARALGLAGGRDLATTAESIRGLRGRPWIAPAFVAVYAVAAAVGLPATILTLAGGALFGTALGTLLNWAGATIGATLGYLLARWLGRDAVRRLLGRRASLLDRTLGSLGFLGMLRLRLIPLVPFNVLDFAAGLAGVPLRAYVLATAIGIIPGCAVYTFFADALLAGAAGARREALVRVAIASALLLALSFAPTLARRMRGAQSS
jgi:uncharacterized membrane protein YdjX (TVP38/TMEM64 family)